MCDSGGVHLALHVYDADGAQNLTLYQLNSLPTRGRLFFNASGPFTDPAAPGAVLVQANDTFLETPGSRMAAQDVIAPIYEAAALCYSAPQYEVRVELVAKCVIKASNRASYKTVEYTVFGV